MSHVECSTSLRLQSIVSENFPIQHDFVGSLHSASLDTTGFDGGSTFGGKMRLAQMLLYLYMSIVPGTIRRRRASKVTVRCQLWDLIASAIEEYGEG